MINKNLHHGDNCPKCKFGLLILKVNKDYQPFLSCDDFPECRFAINLTLDDYKKWVDENKV